MRLAGARGGAGVVAAQLLERREGVLEEPAPHLAHAGAAHVVELVADLGHEDVERLARPLARRRGPVALGAEARHEDERPDGDRGEERAGEHAETSRQPRVPPHPLARAVEDAGTVRGDRLVAQGELEVLGEGAGREVAVLRVLLEAR